jgi:hypothetical protein
MASDALKSAQECLAIQTVHLNHCYANVRPDFDPGRYNKDDLVWQQFNVLQSVDALEFEEENASGYRFVYLLGFRLAGKTEDIDAEDYVPKFEIVGSFCAKYKSSRSLSEDEIKAFSENNIAYHIWPYWREYLQSTAARMGLKEVIEVPMYRVT